VHLLVYQIKGEWQKGRVVSVLFLNIKGTFPNAINKQLVYNLRFRKVPKKIIIFIANILKDRSIILCFNDYVSSLIKLNNSIGHRDLLSRVFYQFYNPNLIEITNTKEGEFAAAYVNDTIVSALADTFKKVHSILNNMIIREGGAIYWAK
jgi:hypothetical protein